MGSCILVSLAICFCAPDQSTHYLSSVQVAFLSWLCDAFAEDGMAVFAVVVAVVVVVVVVVALHLQNEQLQFATPWAPPCLVISLLEAVSKTFFPFLINKFNVTV